MGVPARGDMVLIKGCDQIGEVLQTVPSGHCLVLLPAVDAVVVVRPEQVALMNNEPHENLSGRLRELQRDADSYLHMLMQRPLFA